MGRARWAREWLEQGSAVTACLRHKEQQEADHSEQGRRCGPEVTLERLCLWLLFLSRLGDPWKVLGIRMTHARRGPT